MALEYFLLNNGFNAEEDLIFLKEMRTTFSELYHWRIEGDYEGSGISKKSLKDAIERAEMFINELKKYNKEG